MVKEWVEKDMFTNGLDSIVSEVLKKREIDKYHILGGLDPNAIVLDIGKSVLKIAKMDPFFAEMHMNALEDIHNTLSKIDVAPKLMFQDYHNGYVISEFDKIEKCSKNVSSYEAGCALGRAHRALENIEVRKAFPWDGFYGEKSEFLCIVPMVKNEYIKNTAIGLLGYISDYGTKRNKVQYIHRDLNPDNILKDSKNIYLIDWDMAYGGYIQDDVAMSICCLAPLAQEYGRSLMEHCKDFLRGYNIYNDQDWSTLYSQELISAIALAGLRQGVSGWFSDRGNLSEKYWDNILKRMSIALSLCHDLSCIN